MISSKLRRLFFISIFLFLAHGLEEYLTSFYTFDPVLFGHIGNLSKYLFILTQVILFIAGCVIYRFILSTKFGNVISFLWGLLLIFELEHVYRAISLNMYTPGLFTGVLLVILSIFYWKEIIKPWMSLFILMRESSNHFLWWGLAIIIILGIALFLYSKHYVNNHCQVTIEDIHFRDTTEMDSSAKATKLRQYEGVIINKGDVNVTLKGVNAKFYDKDNKLLTKNYLDYKELPLALTQKTDLFMSINIENESKIAKYEFIPDYTCSNMGSYLN